MKNGLKKNSHRKNAQILCLVLLVVISVVIRVTNLTFGFPTLYIIPDEVANYQSALTMLATKSPLTTSHYPPLGSYVQIPFFVAIYVAARILNLFPSFSVFQLYLLTHEGALLFVPRLISALCGVASIYIAYRFTQALYPQKKYLAFLTVILLTFSTTHIQLSTIGKPIMPAVFFSWLFIYYLYKSTISAHPTRLLLYAILALTGAGSFYFGMLIYLLLYIQVIVFTTHFKQKLRTLSLIFIPLAAFFISLVLKVGAYVPHHLEAWQKFQTNIAEGLVQTVIKYIVQMTLTEPVLTLGFFGGLFFYKQLSPFVWQLVLFSLFYLLIFILMYWYSMRYILPIFLPMTLVTVYTFPQIIGIFTGKSWRWVAGMIMVLLAALPGLTWYLRYKEKPTFIQSANWIKENIAPSRTIAYAGTRFTSFVPAYNSIKLLQEKHPGEYGRLAAVLKPNEYPPNVRELVFLEKMVDPADKGAFMQFLKAHAVDYIVNFCVNPNYQLPEELKSDANVAHFSPFDSGKNYTETDLMHHTGMGPDILHTQRFGPCIDIWKVNLPQ